MKNTENTERTLLQEATALLMDIALKGDVQGIHIERASEFIAKAMQVDVLQHAA